MAYDEKKIADEQMEEQSEDLMVYPKFKKTDEEIAQARIEEITTGIQFHKQQAEQSFIEIGKLLVEAKSEFKKLGHGSWLKWLRNNVEISIVTAQRLMRLATELDNASPVTHLGYTKSFILLGLQPDEREKFMQETHIVNGVEKNADELSKRELEQAVKERKGKVNGSKSSKKGLSEPSSSDSQNGYDFGYLDNDEIDDELENLIEPASDLMEDFGRFEVYLNNTFDLISFLMGSKDAEGKPSENTGALYDELTESLGKCSNEMQMLKLQLSDYVAAMAESIASKGI